MKKCILIKKAVFKVEKNCGKEEKKILLQ